MLSWLVPKRCLPKHPLPHPAMMELQALPTMGREQSASLAAASSAAAREEAITEKSHPFHTLTLTDDDGNLFGFDEYGEEIYDSNYDYYDRLDILCLSSNCATVASMEGMDEQ